MTEAAGGIMCTDHGCIPLTADEASAIYRAAKEQQAERVARIPDERAAIGAMCDGWIRLKEMGWREALYAPRDEPLELIEVGSTGIHHGYRDDLGFWIVDGDTWPSSACLWRPEQSPQDPGVTVPQLSPTQNAPSGALGSADDT